MLNYTPTSWKHMPICIYVHIHSVGLVPDTNFCKFNRMNKPSGLMLELHAIWVADWNLSHPNSFSHPPPIWIYKQSLMKCHCCDMGQGLTGGHVERTHPKLNDHSSCQLTCTKESLRWSILRCCNNPTGEWVWKRLTDKLTKKIGEKKEERWGSDT